MLKTNYIKLYQSGGGFFSLFTNLFGGQKPMKGEQINAEQQASSNIGQTSNPASPSTFGGMTGTQWGQLGGAALSEFGTLSNASQLPSQSQKTEAIADGTVNAVGSALGALGPWGAVAGTALKLVNGIGGSLMNHNSTAKAADAFKINDTVAQSSGYGGVTAGAQAAMGDGQGYKKAGLFGKLFTNTGNLKNELATSASQQKLASGVLDTNKMAQQQSASSAGMFGDRLQQKNYNSQAWNNGAITFGAKGMKIGKSGIHIKKSHEGKFTAYKKRTGETTEEALHSSDPHVRKMANFARNAAKWKHEAGGVMGMVNSGVTPTKTAAEHYKKLGKAVKQVDLKRMKKIALNQQGGVMKQDHTAYKHDIAEEPDNGYTKWLTSLPQRLRETSDYDLKGYFDKYGAVNVVGDQHLTDEFKKPNHVTFSSESIYNSPEHQGGEWRKAQDGKWEFVASPWNIKNVGIDSLQTYFKQNEPSSRLVLPPTSHKDGGAINVIADGAFHSRKHSLKDNPDLADAKITLKGIPVVSEGENGELVQHAEVEKNELILHYDLTKQLEALHKEGTDEAAIQAGRILSKEIVKNTKDSSSKLIKNG